MAVASLRSFLLHMLLLRLLPAAGGGGHGEWLWPPVAACCSTCCCCVCCLLQEVVAMAKGWGLPSQLFAPHNMGLSLRLLPAAGAGGHGQGLEPGGQGHAGRGEACCVHRAGVSSSAGGRLGLLACS